MKKVEVMGLNKIVEINTDTIKPYTIDGEAYEETAIASDGSLVAYCPASNFWVQLYPSRPEDY